jgi:6,7-dimethyl-8-ribityllumazine synthase
MARRHTQSPISPVAIVVSRYNASITDALLAGAVGAYVRAGGRERDCLIVEAPGAYELVALALASARVKSIAGVVALGCIIRGETIHDAVIAHAVANGLVGVMLQTGVPVALGVLTVNTPEQAQARAGGEKGNKGAEAMEALLATLQQVQGLGGAGRGRVRTALAKRPDKAIGASRARA